MAGKPYTADDIVLAAGAIREVSHCLHRAEWSREAAAALDALTAAGWRRPEPPSPARCPATVGDGHSARPMHPDGECQQGRHD